MLRRSAAIDPTASTRPPAHELDRFGARKIGGKHGRVSEDSTADLEVGVEVGEADGGGVLKRAVRLAPTLQRRHCCLRRRAALIPGVGPRVALLVALCFSRYGFGVVKFRARARGTQNCQPSRPGVPQQIGDPPPRTEARSSPSTPMEVLMTDRAISLVY